MSILRKAFVVVASFICSCILYGQEFKIVRPLSHRGPVPAAEVPVDVNGNPCAKIVVELPLRGVEISGGYVVGAVRELVGRYEFYVSVPKREGQVVTLRHSRYLPLDIPLWTSEGALIAREAYTVHVSAPQFSDSQIETSYLVITTDPADADVYLDGEYEGRSPVSKKYEVGANVSWEVRKGRFKTSSGISRIGANRTTVHCTLEPAFGMARITSDPDGAEVYVDDAETSLGKTPILLPLDAGKRLIRLRKELYSEYLDSVMVVAGDTALMHASLNSRFASVSLSTDCEDAVIYVDEIESGKGTVNINLREGIHDITATHPSRRTLTTSIEVVAGVPLEKQFTLEMKRGDLDVVCNAIDAIILIDGEQKGMAPATIRDVPEGRHTLVLRKEGYNSYMTSFEMGDAQSLTIEIKMDATAETAVAQVPVAEEPERKDESAVQPSKPDSSVQKPEKKERAAKPSKSKASKGKYDEKFLLMASAAPTGANLNPLAFGGMVGYGKGFGVYAKAYLSQPDVATGDRISSDRNIIDGANANLPVDTKGQLITSGRSAAYLTCGCAGLMFRLSPSVFIYCGGGILYRDMCWEHTKGGWVEVSDLNRYGGVCDAGLNFSWKKLSFSAGVNTNALFAGDKSIFFSPDFSIGFAF